MSKHFRNEKGFSSAVLRMKEDETADDAIERLRGDGWIIEDYDTTSDPNGHSIIVPKAKSVTDQAGELHGEVKEDGSED